jgi:hypothetical protein
LIRINVGGLSAREMCSLAAQIGGDQVEVRVTTDIVGAREVAQGKADYYFGACATGGGGALSMAIAILGYSNCFTASMAGRLPREEDIQEAVYSGKKAFGFASDHVNSAVPLITKAILAKHNQDK